MSKNSILEDFLGEECSGCGGHKRFGEGYEEAFASSQTWLAENYPRKPQTGKLF